MKVFSHNFRHTSVSSFLFKLFSGFFQDNHVEVIGVIFTIDNNVIITKKRRSSGLEFVVLGGIIYLLYMLFGIL